MPAILEARNVSKVFGGGLFSRRKVVALDNFSLSISEDPPSITAVAGESGSGKTTLIRLLLGFIAPTAGELLHKGKDLRSISSQERRAFRREVQAVSQDPFEAYNPFYKVDHVLTTPVAKFRLARSKEATRELIVQALEAVGLRPDETLGRYPHQLSGGQRQRVMVARALLLRPRVILADEPVSMVDASLRATILQSLRKLKDEFGVSVLYITHDLTTAYQISENIVILYQGSVAEVGDVELIIKDPKHPYTRLLVGSIPLPDPDRKWSPPMGPLAETTGGVNRGCKFAGRCPFVMPICRESPPPLFQTDAHRAASCFLYKDAPVVPGEEMVKVFAPSRTVLAPPHKGLRMGAFEPPDLRIDLPLELGR